ncbi:MAG: VWA domain-containing protein, partial [Bacteroidota bacterium]
MLYSDESTNRLQRWRLVLGTNPPPEESPEGMTSEESGNEAQDNGELSERMQKVDETLDTLYGDPQRRGSIGDSAPYAVRWLADVREYFSQPTAQMLQQEAWERFDWKALVQEPDFLESLEPSVDLVALLVSLKSLLPSQTRETAREVVRKVIEDLQERWKLPLQQAIYGGMMRQRNLRPRKLNEINWHRTILKNLKHYQPSYKTVIPEQLIGWKSQHKQHLHIVLCVDQSASMQQSVVHAGILGAVLAGMPSLTTKLLLFDTQVIDVSDQLNDPIELLFGVQLGGGTHITKALQKAQSLIDLPEKTILF